MEDNKRGTLASDTEKIERKQERRSKQNWATGKKNEEVRTDCTIGKERTNPYQGTNELKLTNKQQMSAKRDRDVGGLNM